MRNLSNVVDRRVFLHRAAIGLPLIGFGLVDLTSCTRADALNNAGTWRAWICSEKEPGEPLIVSGTIYAPDGRTPLEGITLSVYQTDATGVYSTSGGNNRNTRLHGAMRSNNEGRYEFRTIRPGSYPGSTNAAHIHAFIAGPSYPEYWIDEFLFDDDRFVTEDARRKASGQGTFSPIMKVTRGSDGILRGVRDIKVERCSRNCTGN